VYHSLAVYYFSEFIFDDDFFWYVVDANADELRSFQRCHKVEIRYVYVMNPTPLVDMTLLKRSLTTCMSAVGVATAPG
jgi:hypothetical protein